MGGKNGKNQIKLREHVLGWLVSSILTLIVTAAIIYFTSSPVSLEEIKGSFKEKIKKDFDANNKNNSKNIKFDKFKIGRIDLRKKESVIIYGTLRDVKENDFKFVALFEPKAPNYFDKLLGRPGFYNLNSFSYIKTKYKSNLLSKSIKLKDIDNNGIKEVFIRVNSIWADSNSVGLIILRKNARKLWDFLSIPPLTKKLKKILRGKKAQTRPNFPNQPNILFGKEDGKLGFEKSVPLSQEYVIFEDRWTAYHGKKEIPFVTLRSGGLIKDFFHPYRGHFQLAVAANIYDYRSIISNHHIFITFLRIKNGKLEVDNLWNWGRPMVSFFPISFSELKISEIHEKGISSHIENGHFFGYTNYQRARPQ